MLDYRITYDGRVVHDLGVNVACVSATCDLEAGTAGSLTFTLDPTHPLAGEEFRVKDARHEAVLTDRGREIFRGRVTEVEGDADAMVKVTCEGQLAYLGDSTVRDYATSYSDDLPSGTTLVKTGVIDWLVQQHNARVGAEKSFTVGTDGGAWADVRTTDGPSTLSELNRNYCEGQDRYLRARYENGVRYVDVLDGGQGTGTQTIVFGENLMDFASSRSWDDVVTAIVATGRADRESEEALSADVVGGDPIPAPTSDSATRYEQGDTGFGVESIGEGKYVVNDVPVTVEGDRIVGDELAARYGIFEVRRSYDAKTPDQLLRMAAADLDPTASNIRELESVDVTAFDLSATNPSLEPIALLDWERIFAPPYGVDQWMPCSKMHVDVCNPDSTNFHFGDVPATLTRRSALRMGLIQRGTGELIRRAEGAARDADLLKRETDRNSERVGEAVKKAERDLADATDTWANHLDDETAKWYEGLTNAEKEAAQGREELQKHLDELGGTLDGVQELADSARRTFYATCTTEDGEPDKVVYARDITQPGGQTFKLEKGVVIDVYFEHANSSENPTLNVAGSAYVHIKTNDRFEASWDSGTVVRFVYDGYVWRNLNSPVWANEATIGNPSLSNFYTDGQKLDMRIGKTSYWHVDASVERIGREDRRHINVTDSNIAFCDPEGANLEIGYDSSRKTARMDAPKGLVVDGSSGYMNFGNRWSSLSMFSQAGLGISMSSTVEDVTTTFDVSHLVYRTNGRNWVMRSVIVSGTGEDWIKLTPSALGLVNLTGYFLDATNGDYNAKEFFIVGCEVVAGSLYVKFDRPVSGTVRLNFFGVPVGSVLDADQPMPGPEIFDDPTEQEGAS